MEIKYVILDGKQNNNERTTNLILFGELGYPTVA